MTRTLLLYRLLFGSLRLEPAHPTPIPFNVHTGLMLDLPQESTPGFFITQTQMSKRRSPFFQSSVFEQLSMAVTWTALVYSSLPWVSYLGRSCSWKQDQVFREQITNKSRARLWEGSEPKSRVKKKGLVLGSSHESRRNYGEKDLL